MLWARTQKLNRLEHLHLTLFKTMQCLNPECKIQFPTFVWIDGKKRNLRSRKYCMTCSPFGSHNTKKKDPSFDKRTTTQATRARTNVCSDCGNPHSKNQKKGTVCYSCLVKQRKQRIKQRIYKATGTACWLCGYDKGYQGIQVLEWHHVNPKTKLFTLSSREVIGTRWTTVNAELRKCVLLCCRCHREHHAGLIPVATIETVYQQRWENIKQI